MAAIHTSLPPPPPPPPTPTTRTTTTTTSHPKSTLIQQHELRQPPSYANTNRPAAAVPASANTTRGTGGANNLTDASQAQANKPTKPPSSPRSQKPAGLLAVAAAAFDRTISEPFVRNRSSLSTLNRISVALESPTGSEFSTSDRSSRHRNVGGASSASSTPALLSPTSETLDREDPISSPYTETNPNLPPPIQVASLDNKMHQTSSRLLRMTDDDRPFTRDFKDLFSTLIVSLLPLSPHRVRLTRVEHTFLSEDAINNLGSLKFSQSNRMPDPKDPSRIVTTTTTTTFSMAKDMARSICQRFLDARFIESADGKLQQVYTMKGSVWQLTSKRVCVLDRFCSRNGIQQRQIGDLISMGTSHLCILERDPATDKLVMDRGTMEVVFRRLCGVNGLNIKSSVGLADNDSLSDYRDGLQGVKMASERKIGGRVFKDTFTGKGCSDWLMDCCTTVDRRETYEMASLFVEYELMESIVQDRAFIATSPSAAIFQPTKNSVYQLTTRGKEILSGTGRGRTSESEGLGGSRPGVARDSNTQRLDKIMNDAALRLLFRENLRETHCEENLSFYLEVEEFVRSCQGGIKVAQKNPTNTSMDGIKEIMAQAYGIYNAFLAPGSPCELNIDHQLRNNLATRMTKAVGQDGTMIETLHEVMGLFEDAQNAVFKLMASDSVPKFLRNAKYEQTLKNYDFDAIAMGSGPARSVARSQSRSNRG
ncbi:RGS-domain-containing protein [Xylariaceae sp. FL0255]|nr:RGS-domain-containing protein [Xylariaceae sp. FL0255]